MNNYLTFNKHTEIMKQLERKAPFKDGSGAFNHSTVCALIVFQWAPNSARDMIIKRVLIRYKSNPPQSRNTNQ